MKALNNSAISLTFELAKEDLERMLVAQSGGTFALKVSLDSKQTGLNVPSTLKQPLQKQTAQLNESWYKRAIRLQKEQRTRTATRKATASPTADPRIAGTTASASKTQPKTKANKTKAAQTPWADKNLIYETVGGQREVTRSVPATYVRYTPGGRGTTKQVRSSDGMVFDSARLAGKHYGVSRETIYNHIWGRCNLLGLTLEYTGVLVPRWYYDRNSTESVYPNIRSASAGENQSQLSIFQNIRGAESEVDWRVFHPVIR